MNSGFGARIWVFLVKQPSCEGRRSIPVEFVHNAARDGAARQRLVESLGLCKQPPGPGQRRTVGPPVPERKGQSRCSGKRAFVTGICVNSLQLTSSFDSAWSAGFEWFGESRTSGGKKLAREKNSAFATRRSFHDKPTKDAIDF